MYQQFFSLKVKPFSISPDPDFLFLSGRHKEAITHLQHGLLGHAGFVLLTGEVGTGKTTICRSLVDNMGDDTDIAFILNPALSEVELLTTICDSFNIKYQENNLSSLFNKLSAWVVANHQNNRHAIVLIDEAQHLSFAAFEQLRLLTSIETNNKKSLQVILIGQTELQEKLKKDEFRQLAQSITARYHLLSLTQQESSIYIQHRLNIAGSTHAIFDKSALQEVFKECDGIPRLINILCDRSLLAAYTENSHIVTVKMVKKVSKEVHFSHDHIKKNFISSHWRLATLTFLIAFTLLQAPKISQYITSTDLFTPIEGDISFNTELSPSIEPITDQINEQWFDAYPQLDLTHVKYKHALSTLYSIWGYKVEADNATCKQGSVVLLSCYTQKINLNKLKQLNYPSVIRLQKDSDTILYAVIYKISDNYQLLIDGYLINVSEQWFKNYWSGDVTLLWKMPFPLKGTIKFDQDGEEVTWLANLLNKDQGWPIEHKTHFDLRLLEQVSSFQREHGLMDDGIVGPRTFMPLMQLAMPNSPRLLQEIQ
jgi:general secretion pathway protein A